MIRLKVGLNKKETGYIKHTHVPAKGDFVIYENKEYQVAEVVHYLGEIGDGNNGVWIWIMPVNNGLIQSF